MSLFVSCSTSNRENKTTNKIAFKDIETSNAEEMRKTGFKSINIDISNDFKNLNIDQAISEMKYIPLETTDNSLIGRIDKIIIDKGQIFILDQHFAKSIFVFDKQGKHSYTINKRGRGPKEYIRITDFIIKHDTIVIFDEFGKKLLFLDRNGNYIKEKKTGFRFQSFAAISNEDYVFATGNSQNYFNKEINNYGLLIGTCDSIIKYKGFKNNSFLKDYDRTLTNPIKTYNDQTLFSPLLSGCIFSIKPDGSYIPKYKLRFKNGLPENYSNETTPENFDKYLKRNKYSYFHGEFYENKSHLFIRYNPPGNYYGYVIFNKQTGQSLCFDGTYSPEKKYLGYSSPKLVYNEFFVGHLEPHTIIKNKKALLKNNPGSVHLTKLLNTIKNEDNPILILYKFK